MSRKLVERGREGDRGGETGGGGWRKVIESSVVLFVISLHRLLYKHCNKRVTVILTRSQNAPPPSPSLFLSSSLTLTLFVAMMFEL